MNIAASKGRFIIEASEHELRVLGLSLNQVTQLHDDDMHTLLGSDRSEVREIASIILDALEASI